MIWIFFIQPILAIQGFQDQEGGQGITPSPSNDTRSLLCTPFGVCEPCPVDSVRSLSVITLIDQTTN